MNGSRETELKETCATASKTKTGAAMSVFREVVSAVAYIHSKKCMHLDLKCDTCMVFISSVSGKSNMVNWSGQEKT